jgi:ubiquinone/menaquinone biosynthesis C-methylase UbiE
MREQMDAEAIKKYWDNRAKQDKTGQATTDDVYMREIERREVLAAIKQVPLKQGDRVVDVGCGDGVTAAHVAEAIRSRGGHVIGADFSGEMIKKAKALETDNLSYMQFDIMTDWLPCKFIYTTRCIINLPSWPDQRKALINIRKSLLSDGKYVMIENFLAGQRNLNTLRVKYELESIPIRKHNKFLSGRELAEFMRVDFELEEAVNISSSYYLATRVIYAKLCQLRGMAPDYFSDEHRLAVDLPYCGNFGPIYRLTWRAK